MASVIQSPSHLAFSPTSADRKSSPYAYGSSLSPSLMSGGWHTAFNPQSQPSYQSFTPERHQSPKAHQKRRHEDEDEDQTMERSPAPERRMAGRLVPKRLRTTGGQQEGNSGNNNQGKESKAPGVDDVDVGLLLARLPPQSLLSLVTSLLASEPSLKPKVLSLIPRPTLDSAIDALAQAAKKLRDAYPYSMTSPSTQSTPFSHSGFGTFSSRPSPVSFGFAASGSGFGAARSNNSANQAEGLRDEYVLSRLRPHISEFITVAFSYLPYFSSLPSSQGANKDPVHEQCTPMEAFDYLTAVTGHLVAQPSLAQSSLAPALLPRLLQEWLAWVDKVDAHLNKEGGMFRQDVVRGWERILDNYATVTVSGASDDTKTGLIGVRDKWVARVGWVVGRRGVYSMDEEKES